MIKPIYLKFSTLSLVLILAACGGVEAGPTLSPAEPQEPAVAPVSQPEPVEEQVSNVAAPEVREEAPAEDVVEAAPAEEEPAPAVEAAAVEEPAAIAEPASPEEEHMTGEMAEKEEAMPDETLTVEEAPTAAQQQLLASLDVKGVPPELHNEVWLNSEPLKLADLQGKVVIVEFWTFG